MNSKTMKSFLYQFRDSKKAAVIYCFIAVAVYIIIFTTTSVTIIKNQEYYDDNLYNYSYGIGGAGASTAIFLFCACAFKENFHMLMQNGVSRTSVYLGRILNSAVLSLIFALFDIIIKYIFTFLASMVNDHFIFSSLFEGFYNGYYREKHSVIIFIVMFLFFFVLFMFFHTLGYLMSTVFYRLGKTAKGFFAAGVPVSMFVIFPAVDNIFFEGNLSRKLIDLFIKIFGLNEQNPFIGILTLTIGALLCIALSWLPIRRARVE